MNDNEKVIKGFLIPFNADIESLAQDMRRYLKSETKPRFELVGDSTVSVNIGYGFTRKAWDCYCAIIVYSKHINLSFPSGAFLPDPTEKLLGTGKRIRHIKVGHIDDLKEPDVAELIQAARELALEDLTEKELEFDEVETVIKSVGGIKKRPKPDR